MIVDPIPNTQPMHIVVPAENAKPVQRDPAGQVTASTPSRASDDAASRQEHANAFPNQSVDVDKAFEEINAAMHAWDTGMRFEIDKDTHQIVVSIVDSATGDVLRQIPSEEVLHVAKMIAQFQGNLVNVKA